MRGSKTNKVFFSAHRSDRSHAANESNHAKALDLLRREGVAYRTVTGAWKGATETTILIEASDVRTHELNLDLALNMARLFSQDAVLEVANDDTALLHDTGGGSGTRVLGRFREASRSEALSQDGYTYDQASDRYYVVEAA